jgi:hypothetical protein
VAIATRVDVGVVSCLAVDRVITGTAAQAYRWC